MDYQSNQRIINDSVTKRMVIDKNSTTGTVRDGRYSHLDDKAQKKNGVVTSFTIEGTTEKP
jgi:hypothetical protein